MGDVSHGRGVQNKTVQALKESGPSKGQMQGRRIRRQVSRGLVHSPRQLVGPLGDTGCWTRGALGLIQHGSSDVPYVRTINRESSPQDGSHAALTWCPGEEQAAWIPQGAWPE